MYDSAKAPLRKFEVSCRVRIIDLVGIDCDRNPLVIPYISIVFSRENGIIPIGIDSDKVHNTCPEATAPIPPVRSSSLRLRFRALGRAVRFIAFSACMPSITLAFRCLYEALSAMRGNKKA